MTNPYYLSVILRLLFVFLLIVFQLLVPMENHLSHLLQKTLPVYYTQINDHYKIQNSIHNLYGDKFNMYMKFVNINTI